MGEKYSKEREKDYPLSTKVAKMGDAAVEDMMSGKVGKGLGRYALGAGMYVPAVAVDTVKRAFKKDDTQEPDETKMRKGGKVSSASSRADGCAIKGKTKGRFV